MSGMFFGGTLVWGGVNSHICIIEGINKKIKKLLGVKVMQNTSKVYKCKLEERIRYFIFKC